MKIKSLILGSAAALLAVSGAARAADAVMAPEPEPAEYVKVCDAYGAGFFYIPGTQTCMSINGYVWFQLGATSQKDNGDTQGYWFGPSSSSPAYKDGGWNTGSRVRMNFDLRSDTELGTLRGWIRLQADFDGSKVGDGGVGIDQAWVQLGGLAMGYGESAWFYQFNNSTLNYGDGTYGGNYYGYQERSQIRYEFGGKTGVYGLISLENPADKMTYMPDIVGRIGYGGTWGAVALTAAYDADRNGAVAGTPSAVALSASALFNLPSMPGSAIKVTGYYNSADSNYGPGSPWTNTWFNGGQPEWSVLAGFIYQATPTLGIIIGGQYMSDVYYVGTSTKAPNSSSYSVDADVVWTPVKNFEVRPEIVYTKAEGYDGTVSGFLRFTRYF